jgi:hypothetical protein
MTNPKDRWIGIAFVAVAGISGATLEVQDVFLRELLKTHFADVPDQIPSRDDDAQAWAAFSVKWLLGALVAEGDDHKRMKIAADMAFARVLPREPPP